MKVDVDEDGTLVLKEIYCGTALETSEGNRLNTCMRDDTFEFNFTPKGETVGVWYRFNMQTRNIEKL